MQSRDRQVAVDRPLTSRHSRGNRSLTVVALPGAVPLDPLLRRALHWREPAGCDSFIRLGSGARFAGIAHRDPYSTARLPLLWATAWKL